jgi:hypothetical protein
MDKFPIMSHKVTRLKSVTFICGGGGGAYSNNPHTLDELKHNICETVVSIGVSELKLASNNLFRRLQVCLRAEERHFEHRLRWSVLLYNSHT